MTIPKHTQSLNKTTKSIRKNLTVASEFTISSISLVVLELSTISQEIQKQVIMFIFYTAHRVK